MPPAMPTGGLTNRAARGAPWDVSAPAFGGPGGVLTRVAARLGPDAPRSRCLVGESGHSGTTVARPGGNGELDGMTRTSEATGDMLFASLVDLSADAILTVSPEEVITSWNRGAAQLFGWAAEEVVGRSFTVLLPDEERDLGELDWIHRTTLAQGSIRDYETRRKRKDGSIFEVSLTRTAVLDDAGQLIGFTAILRDITYRKRLERELLAGERLKTAGQVSAGIAHQIGAPLTAVSIAGGPIVGKRG